MSITYKVGSLFDTEMSVIAHGVNCKGVFGAGIAKKIALLFPEVRHAYDARYRHVGWRLGDVQYVKCKDGFVANMATQDSYGRTGVYVSYSAVEKCLTSLFHECEARQIGVAMPRVGCGLAGGDWDVVRNIIEFVAADYDVDVEVWSLPNE